MAFQLVAAHELAIVVADYKEVSVAKVKVSFCDVPQNQKNVPQNGLRKMKEVNGGLLGPKMARKCTGRLLTLFACVPQLELRWLRL